eukprot:459140_1
MHAKTDANMNDNANSDENTDSNTNMNDNANSDENVTDVSEEYHDQYGYGQNIDDQDELSSCKSMTVVTCLVAVIVILEISMQLVSDIHLFDFVSLTSINEDNQDNKLIIFIGDSIIRFLAMSMIETLSHDIHFCDYPGAIGRPNCKGEMKYFDMKRCGRFIKNIGCLNADHYTKLNHNETIIYYLSAWDFRYINDNIISQITALYSNYHEEYRIYVVTGILLHILEKMNGSEYNRSVLQYFQKIAQFSDQQIWFGMHHRILDLVPAKYRVSQSNEIIDEYNQIAKTCHFQYVQLPLNDNETGSISTALSNDGTHMSYAVNRKKVIILCKRLTDSFKRIPPPP